MAPLASQYGSGRPFAWLLLLIGAKHLRSIQLPSEEDLHCEGGELNPHALRHWILSPARLPVPPPSLIYIYCVCTTELIVSTLVSELQFTLSEKRLAPARFQQAVVCEAGYMRTSVPPPSLSCQHNAFMIPHSIALFNIALRHFSSWLTVAGFTFFSRILL